MNFVEKNSALATAQVTAAMHAARHPSLRAAGPVALTQATIDQRESTLLALEPLNGDRWLGPLLPIVNPPLWELGHVGWFHERWCLRERSVQLSGLPAKSILPDADKLYDSTPIAHNLRWGLPLVQPAAVLDYLAEVLDEALIALDKLPDGDAAIYFHRLSLFHEMMHREAFCYTWQTHGYQRPQDLPIPRVLGQPEWLSIGADNVMVGSEADEPFMFDNEKFGHVVAVDAFQVSNQVVSAGEFAQFVLAGGYDRAEFWPAGLLVGKHESSAHCPRYWRLGGRLDGRLDGRRDRCLVRRLGRLRGRQPGRRTCRGLRWRPGGRPRHRPRHRPRRRPERGGIGNGKRRTDEGRDRRFVTGRRHRRGNALGRLVRGRSVSPHEDLVDARRLGVGRCRPAARGDDVKSSDGEHEAMGGPSGAMAETSIISPGSCVTFLPTHPLPRASNPVPARPTRARRRARVRTRPTAASPP